MNSKHDCFSLKNDCVSLVPIFNHLPPKQLNEIASMSNHEEYLKGHAIFNAGDQTQELLIVHKGKVKIYKLSASGKEQLLRILYPGDFFGELSLFSTGTINSYAEALEDSEICTISRPNLQKLLKNHPDISIKLLEEFSRRLEQTESLLEQLSSHDVEKRISHYLMDLFQKTGNNTITLPMSKKDLSSLIGTTQETLSRRLTSLQEKGVINQSGQRTVTILDLDQLQQIIRF